MFRTRLAIISVLSQMLDETLHGLGVVLADNTGLNFTGLMQSISRGK